MRFLFRKKFKQSLKKSFGLFVVFSMILQSVGLPGFTAIALASESESEDTKVEVSEEESTSSEKQEKASQEKEQEDEKAEKEDDEDGQVDTEKEETSQTDQDKDNNSDEEKSSDQDEDEEKNEDSSKANASEEDEKGSDGEKEEQETSSDYTVVSEGEELNLEEGKGVILDTAVSTERETADEDTQEEEQEQEEKTEEEGDDAKEDASEWIEDAEEKGYEVIEVKEGEEYEYGGKGFSIYFTDIDEDVDEAYRIIAIKEVTLSQERQEALGAVSDTAYDVISPMENESFSYELTLPTPEGSDGNSVEIVYAEDEESLNDSEKVKSVEKEAVSVEDGGKKTKVKDLDHFTIFVVTSPDPVSSDCSGSGVGIAGTDECYNTIQEAIDAAVKAAV